MKNSSFATISDFAPTRRQLASAQAAVPATAQKIADHFSSVKSMAGEFVQFGPKGEQTGGKFFLERPGKIRFNYDGTSNFRVVSDGKSVVILNKRLKTSDLYPLSKTPLK
ncbi:MAG: outer membrane lipoprotein carrier protein LolA, partial [Mesorhizobium sp.]